MGGTSFIIGNVSGLLIGTMFLAMFAITHQVMIPESPLIWREVQHYPLVLENVKTLERIQSADDISLHFQSYLGGGFLGMIGTLFMGVCFYLLIIRPSLWFSYKQKPVKLEGNKLIFDFDNAPVKIFKTKDLLEIIPFGRDFGNYQFISLTKKRCFKTWRFNFREMEDSKTASLLPFSQDIVEEFLRPELPEEYKEVMRRVGIPLEFQEGRVYFKKSAVMVGIFENNENIRSSMIGKKQSWEKEKLEKMEFQKFFNECELSLILKRHVEEINKN